MRPQDTLQGARMQVLAVRDHHQGRMLSGSGRHRFAHTPTVDGLRSRRVTGSLNPPTLASERVGIPGKSPHELCDEPTNSQIVAGQYVGTWLPDSVTQNTPRCYNSIVKL